VKSEACNIYTCPSHVIGANGLHSEDKNLGRITGFLPTPWDMSEGDLGTRILKNITLGKVHLRVPVGS
jgi:hypothetical protein